ncbi:MAG: hypothetical protein L0170_04405, partial [Acidobacteria bacterium]|nr:hypothetical protein [Acidobacteriota bacterium]
MTEPPNPLELRRSDVQGPGPIEDAIRELPAVVPDDRTEPLIRERTQARRINELERRLLAQLAAEEATSEAPIPEGEVPFSAEEQEEEGLLAKMTDLAGRFVKDVGKGVKEAIPSAARGFVKVLPQR